MYVSLFFLLFDNVAFFSGLFKVYPLEDNSAFLFSIAIIVFSFTVFIFTLLSSRWTLKPLLIVVVLISALTNYFMNTYHIVVDASMIRNTLQTDLHESMDLLSIKELLYLILLGILPAFIIYKIPLQKRPFKKVLESKVKTLILSLVLIAISLFSFNKYYTSFFREHKPLRYTVNPLYWIYSTGKYISLTYNSAPLVLKPMGIDAKVVADGAVPKLVIMVVGEAARADHFSLNGYARETNPKLKMEEVINFPNMYSCGTSTAVSVPCMFSLLSRDAYSYKKGRAQENVIDVLKHTKKVALLWRDNNSDSKGVALRIPYENYKISQNNQICSEGECRDIGMLKGLDSFIRKHQDKDILIVLHQMGNHGPAYYKRYTKAYEKFTPVCNTNQLESCIKEEITNAYDNAILYTDTFLSKVIAFLKTYDKSHRTAMIYMADHGESLGENGLYLHGLPYFMAPDAQKHIGALMWFGTQMKRSIDITHLQSIASKKFSQDNLAYTLLGLFNVQTKVYQPKMDILHAK